MSVLLGIARAITFFQGSNLESPEMLSKGVTNQFGTIPPGPARSAVGRPQEFLVQNNLDYLHMWTLFHSILHSEWQLDGRAGLGFFV